MTVSPDFSELMMMTLQTTIECALMLLQHVHKILNVIFSNLVFCSSDITQHKFVALRALEAGDFPPSSSSVATDPLPNPDVAPLH